ncbi:fimbrial protein, partial [Pseudomonas fragi]|uniref:fimbrial protein n=1 Tax=Pseudomonas fragi TaxID=296 RepID=UPI0015CC3B0C
IWLIGGSDQVVRRISAHLKTCSEIPKQVPYTVTCGPQPTNDMTIELQGGGASFDRALLMTSKSNLGIKFLVGGATWSLNSPVNFTYPTLPQMEAVLVAKPGSTLAGGAFSASATIVISLR